jgi:UDP-N-acetylmuramoylalanine--D-glutamate ligase
MNTVTGKKFKDIYGGKTILIAGFGRSGRAALRALDGIAGRIAVYDAKEPGRGEPSAEYYFGGSVPPKQERFDYVVLSPGVPPQIPAVANATSAGAQLTGDLELAYHLEKGRYVAITGTNGKTTTTALTGEIWRAAGIASEVTGNIGTPVIESALEAPDGCEFITEVSSFQLETIGEFRPYIAAFLNLTPDHLDRYGRMEAYGAAKARIFMNQKSSDFLVLNADDAGVMAIAERAYAEGFESRKVLFSRRGRVENGAFAEDGRIYLARNGAARFLLDAAELIIPGSHNLENALSAAAMAACAEIPDEVIVAALRSFKGVAHRMELIDIICEVRFVNDSKGTNTDASQKAIDAVDGAIILIAGGYDKQADFSEFIRGFGSKVKHLILLGETAERFADTAKREGFTDYTIVADMDEAVERAQGLAKPGYTVLLSPASASWDQYDNFEQRGDHFRALVQKLRERADR